MKTFTFGILGESGNSNLTRVLPYVFDIGDYKFVFTGAHALPHFIGDEHDVPDIILKQETNQTNKLMPLMVPTPTPFGVWVTVPRFSKGVYNYMLNRIFKHEPAFLPILSYTASAHVPEFKGSRTLFRTGWGARGKGFGFVPEGKTAYWVNEKFIEARAKRKFSVIEDAGIIMEFDSHRYEEREQQNEAFTDSNSLEFVRHIQDVVSEYRLITDHLGNFAICVRRNRVEKACGLMMAIGSEANREDVVYFNTDGIAKFNDPVLAKIAPSLKAIPHMPLHSFDLFITANGQWGFFEASCEFGESAVPSGWVFKEAKLYMENLAKTYL